MRLVAVAQTSRRCHDIESVPADRARGVECWTLAGLAPLTELRGCCRNSRGLLQFGRCPTIAGVVCLAPIRSLLLQMFFYCICGWRGRPSLKSYYDFGMLDRFSWCDVDITLLRDILSKSYTANGSPSGLLFLTIHLFFHPFFWSYTSLFSLLSVFFLLSLFFDLAADQQCRMLQTT